MYFANCFKGLCRYSWHKRISLHCTDSGVNEDQSQWQAFSRSANWESLKWVHCHCCMGWRQAVVYRRRKSANFHWAEDGSGQPPLAACEQEWTLYVRLVWTCSGSRAGHQNKKTALCVCTSTRSAPGVVTKEAEQNWSKCSFHFCYSVGKEKKKTCHSQKLYPQLDFFKKHFLKQEQSILLVLTDSPSSSTNIH